MTHAPHPDARRRTDRSIDLVMAALLALAAASTAFGSAHALLGAILTGAGLALLGGAAVIRIRGRVAPTPRDRR